MIVVPPSELYKAVSVDWVKYFAVDINSVLGKSSLQEAYEYLIIIIYQLEQRVKLFSGSRNRDLGVNGFFCDF